MKDVCTSVLSLVVQGIYEFLYSVHDPNADYICTHVGYVEQEGLWNDVYIARTYTLFSLKLRKAVYVEDTGCIFGERIH